MRTEEIIQVHEDSPLRCQAVKGESQCGLMRQEGSNFCPVHSGPLAKAKDKNVKNYRIDKYQARLQELGSDKNSIKDLSEEVGLLRILIEERFRIINSPNELYLHSGPISDLIVKVTKTVQALHKIQMHMGLYLDKAQALQFAQEIVQIVATHVTDPASLDKIIIDIKMLMERQDNVKSSV